MHYTMVIEWSDEDNAFLVRLPEWEAEGWVAGPVAHGATHEEAVREGQDALQELVAAAQARGEPLPARVPATVEAKTQDI